MKLERVETNNSAHNKPLGSTYYAPDPGNTEKKDLGLAHKKLILLGETDNKHIIIKYLFSVYPAPYLTIEFAVPANAFSIQSPSSISCELSRSSPAQRKRIYQSSF